MATVARGAAGAILIVQAAVGRVSISDHKRRNP
jgi:hypothetical protein